MRNCRGLVFFAAFLVLVFLAAGCGSGNPKEKGSSNDTQGITIGQLDRDVADDPDNPRVYHERARYYYVTRDLDKAVVDVRKAISLNEKEPSFYLTLSDILLLQGKPDESKTVLEKALSLDPGSNKTLLKLAKLNLIMKEYGVCFDYVNKALATEKTNPEAYFIRALGLLEKGDTNRAIGDLMKAVDQDQKYFEGYMQLGDLYALRTDPMTASFYTNAVNIRPTSKEALYKLGMFYQETGEFEKAIEAYGRLMQVDSAFRNAPYNIGYIYLVYLNDLGKSVEYFTKAVLVDPGYFEAWYNRGYAHELMGAFDKAKADYKQALSIEVNYPKAVDGLNRLDENYRQSRK